MAFLKQLLAATIGALAALPVEIVAAVWRVIVLLLLVILWLFRLLWLLLRRLAGNHDETPPRQRDCHEVPPHVKRKPDPCLYSQWYLMAQGLSVTWDNPDIRVTLPDGTAVDSMQLHPDADYVVHVRIHDASFDPSLATEVRCFYRPWSFNTPDRTPIEFNPDGTERVVLLHIPPWQSREASFRWHTPNTPGAHHCLQAHCRQPDDKNPNNNLGQENTQLVSAAPGARITVRAPLFNPGRAARRVRVAADRYAIPTGEVELRLAQRKRHLRRRGAFDGLRGAMLTRDAARGGLRRYADAGLWFVAYRYRGFEAARRGSERAVAPVAAPWGALVDGRELRDGFVELELGAGEVTELPLTIAVPDGLPAGSRHPFNFTASTVGGQLLGGVTVLVEIA